MTNVLLSKGWWFNDIQLARSLTRFILTTKLQCDGPRSLEIIPWNSFMAVICKLLGARWKKGKKRNNSSFPFFPRLFFIVIYLFFPPPLPPSFFPNTFEIAPRWFIVSLWNHDLRWWFKIVSLCHSLVKYAFYSRIISLWKRGGGKGI